MSATWRILEGDCRGLLAGLPGGSVQTVVTSPPYFGLRDYGVPPTDWPAVDYRTLAGSVHVEPMRCCLGLERAPDAFVGHLVLVMREVRRVLRDDGTVWLNLGDSYAGSWGAQSRGSTSALADRSVSAQQILAHPKRTRTGSIPAAADYKAKDLLGIPWMVAFALRADGWYLRSDIIWAKPNPMPESVTDRPTKAHEYVFLLSKGPRYFYDADAIREDLADANAQRTTAHYDTAERYGAGNGGNGGLDSLAARMRSGDHAGRNKRSVWTVASQPYPGAHFATFPPKLIEPCILAGAPERACSECGAPWERIVERKKMIVKPTPKRAEWQANDDHARTQTGGTMVEPPSTRTVGFKPSCEHNAPSSPGVVLDPFAGAGTTGMVALRHGRSFVGIELNPEFVQLARERIIEDAPLLNPATEVAA